MNCGCENVCNCLPKETCVKDCRCDCIDSYATWQELLTWFPQAKTNSQTQYQIKELIAEASAKFDDLVQVSRGYFSVATGCLKKRKFVVDLRTARILLPPVKAETIQVVFNGQNISHLVGYSEFGLIYKPCHKCKAIVCQNGCGLRKVTRTDLFPIGCYEIYADWGLRCSDMSVIGAIREYVQKKYLEWRWFSNTKYDENIKPNFSLGDAWTDAVKAKQAEIWSRSFTNV